MNYIMFASHFEKKRMSVEDIIDAESGSPGGEITIIVAQREFGYNKYAPCFIISSGRMTMQLGRHSYTQDTGLGYKNKGRDLFVENVITVHKDGVIAKTLTKVGLEEKRSPWVFK